MKQKKLIERISIDQGRKMIWLAAKLGMSRQKFNGLKNKNQLTDAQIIKLIKITNYGS